ncbi:MAG: TetR/AcrR family transcriptional regulator [Pseudomonadota bacterium]
MNAPQKTYHHGDLRAALLSAAEEELTEKGREAFSLRSVARRAGVSHAAPAHHFGDVTGLLTALAASGYERFLATQKARQAKAEDAPREQMIQSGLGYIDFALAHPALFRLMFGSKWPEGTNDELMQTSAAAFFHLVDNVQAITGGCVETDAETRTTLAGVWSIVHGLADLMIADSPRYLMDAPEEEREAMLREIISRNIP